MSTAKASLIREQLTRAHGVFEGAMAGLTAESAHWQPGGEAHSIAANAAHIILIEDGVINGLLKGAAPLFMSSHAGSTGVSELPPAPTEEGLPSWHEWGLGLQVDLTQLHEYAQAVFASSDAYLADLTDEELESRVQTAVGERSRFDMLNGAVLSNCQWHTGEISAVKGIQGLQGYAF